MMGMVNADLRPLCKMYIHIPHTMIHMYMLKILYTSSVLYSSSGYVAVSYLSSLSGHSE